MGQSIAVITDSLACLTPELLGQYRITTVPLSFMVLGKVYRDLVDISPSQAYELFMQEPDSFRTSAPAPMDFLNAYHEVSRNARNIICITLSDKLSNTYNVALMAKEQAKSDLPDTTIEVIDSRTTTAAEGFVVLAAARAIAAGKDFATVLRETREMRKRVFFLAFLDTLRHVYRSGRIPKIASQIGSVLQVKPILSITAASAGKVHFDGMARTRQSGVKRIISMMRDNVGDSPVHVAVMHTYAEEEAIELKETVAASFNCAELWLTEMSPLMGYATGTGTLGLAYYKEG
jgi:DegV family protein with EDD domain